MNKNNGLWIGIAGLLVIAVIVAIVMATNKSTTPVETPTTTPVVAVIPTVSEPSVEEPDVEPLPVVMVPIVTPVKKPTTSPVVGQAPGLETQEVSSLSATSAVLNGRLVTHNVETYYSFQYGTTTALGLETRVAPIAGSNNASDITLAVFNLMPHTTYYYQLHAHNQYGVSSDGVHQFTTPNVNGTVVMSPATSSNALAPGLETQEVSSLSATSAVLNGRLVTHNVETYYSFQYGTTTALGLETRVAPIAGSNNTLDVTLAVFNLMPHTTYYYQLHAHNQYGVSVDSMRQFVTAQ